MTGPQRAARQGNIDSLVGKLLLQLFGLQLGGSCRNHFFQLGTSLIDYLTEFRTLLRCQLAEALQHAGYFTLFTQETNPDIIELRQSLSFVLDELRSLFGKLRDFLFHVYPPQVAYRRKITKYRKYIIPKDYFTNK